MTVLIMTHTEENESFDIVARALARRGHEAIRCDTDFFPTRVQLAVHHGAKGERVEMATAAGEPLLDLSELTAVWNRRFGIGKDIPESLDPQLRIPSVEESRRTLYGALDCLDLFFLDPRHRVVRANSKSLQLRIARQLGIEVPRTVITNDPRQVRDFAAACDGRIVCKMMTSFAVYDDAGRENVVFTNPLSAADIEDMRGLEMCPMTFQEMVPKALELRVTVVGHRVFTAAIESQGSEKAKDDWRRDGAGLVGRWRPHELPAELERRLLALCDRLGLNYGAIDVIKTPDGRWVFLEINPAGEFFWLDQVQDTPISDALADVLVDPAKRRVP